MNQFAALSDSSDSEGESKPIATKKVTKPKMVGSTKLVTNTNKSSAAGKVQKICVVPFLGQVRIMT